MKARRSPGSSLSATRALSLDPSCPCSKSGSEIVSRHSGPVWLIARSEDCGVFGCGPKRAYCVEIGSGTQVASRNG